MRIQFSAQPARAYLIEASTNLVDWDKIGVAIEWAPGEFEYQESTVPPMPARFYRIVVP